MFKILRQNHSFPTCIHSLADRKVHLGPAQTWLNACIQPEQQKRGDRWRKMCQADNTAFCHWWCNAGLPGKRGEEPGLWFLLEQRAEFSYSCLCSILSLPTRSASGQDLQRNVLVPGDGLICGSCSTAEAVGFSRSKPQLCEALVT